MGHEHQSSYSVEPYRSIVLPLVKKGVSIFPYIFTVIQAQGYRRSFSTLKDVLTHLHANPTENASPPPTCVTFVAKSSPYVSLAPSALSSQGAVAIKVLEDQYPPFGKWNLWWRPFSIEPTWRPLKPGYSRLQSSIPEIQNVNIYFYSD